LRPSFLREKQRERERERERELCSIESRGAACITILRGKEEQEETEKKDEGGSGEAIEARSWRVGVVERGVD